MAEDAPWERLIGAMDAVHRDTSTLQSVTSTNAPQVLSELKVISSKLDTIVQSLARGGGGGASASPGAGPTRSVSPINPSLSGAGGTASGQAPGGTPSGGAFASKASSLAARFTGAAGPVDDPRIMMMQGRAVMGGIQALSQVAGQVGQAIDSRIQSGAMYSLSADKMNIMYQQMFGMSQQRTQDVFRYPLTGYRLGGPGAINDVLAMQARTGISAAGQASSIEAMRTLSGYSLSAQDAASMVSTLGSAQVANRMFMTTGQSLYGIGGKQNTSLSVMQNIIRSAGLTNEKMVQGAMQQGSASRARLDFMGVPQDMQDTILQYAQSNIQFQKKGGTGFYDPSKAADRKRMGIEENYSTQAEETARIKGKREEDLYNRQQDNYAKMEKQVQSLTKVFGALEDKLSGILGLVTQNRAGAKVAGSALKTFGMGAAALGMSALAMSNPIGWVGLGAGFLGAVGGSFFSGDPVEGGGKASAAPASGITTIGTDTSKMSIPFGSNKTMPFGALGAKSSFTKLHPTMQDRIKKMIIASGGRVGWGEGFRTREQQTSLFLSRHTQVSASEGAANPEKYKVWDNKYWAHTSGPPAARPGMSMHEIGLAADLAGDYEWIKAHAHEFGLRHFGDVNGEPWHVQPSELPGDRAAYEERGAPWGHGPGGAAPYIRDDYELKSPSGYPNATEDFGETSHTSISGLSSFGQSSIAEIIESLSPKNAAIGAGGSGAGGLRYGTSSNTSKSIDVNSASGGALSAKQMVLLLRGAGFKDDGNMQRALGISHRESRWNPGAYNPGRAGALPENSFGLFQFNMVEGSSVTNNRLSMYGLSAREDLYVPENSAHAAYVEMVQRGNYSPWYAKYNDNGKLQWDAKGTPGSELIGWTSTVPNLAAAAQIISDANRGDPVANGTSRAAASVTTNNVTGGTVINIAPTVNISGSGSSGDLQMMARAVGDLLRKEAALAGFRSS